MVAPQLRSYRAEATAPDGSKHLLAVNGYQDCAVVWYATDPVRCPRHIRAYGFCASLDAAKAQSDNFLRDDAGAAQIHFRGISAIFAEIFHGTRMASVRCAPPVPVEMHVVSVFDGAAWWEFSINPRVTTPWRMKIVCENAKRYVASRLAA